MRNFENGIRRVATVAVHASVSATLHGLCQASLIQTEVSPASVGLADPCNEGAAAASNMAGLVSWGPHLGWKSSCRHCVRGSLDGTHSQGRNNYGLSRVHEYDT